MASQAAGIQARFSSALADATAYYKPLIRSGRWVKIHAVHDWLCLPPRPQDSCYFRADDYSERWTSVYSVPRWLFILEREILHSIDLFLDFGLGCIYRLSLVILSADWTLIILIYSVSGSLLYAASSLCGTWWFLHRSSCTPRIISLTRVSDD